MTPEQYNKLFNTTIGLTGYEAHKFISDFADHGFLWSQTIYNRSDGAVLVAPWEDKFILSCTVPDIAFIVIGSYSEFETMLYLMNLQMQMRAELKKRSTDGIVRIRLEKVEKQVQDFVIYSLAELELLDDANFADIANSTRVRMEKIGAPNGFVDLTMLSYCNLLASDIIGNMFQEEEKERSSKK